MGIVYLGLCVWVGIVCVGLCGWVTNVCVDQVIRDSDNRLWLTPNSTFKNYVNGCPHTERKINTVLACEIKYVKYWGRDVCYIYGVGVVCDVTVRCVNIRCSNHVIFEVIYRNTFVPCPFNGTRFPVSLPKQMKMESS